jgi:methyl-accepting chemotaxis protein
MIIYFLLIGSASLLMGVEFLIDTHGPELKEKLFSNFEKNSRNQMEIDQVFVPVERLRNKALLMIAVIMVVMVIVLTMFIKNITEPLQHMIESSKEISKGDLSQNIKIQSTNELAELGNVINEMSSNLQEIILLSKNMCSAGNDFIRKTSATLKHQKLSHNDINKIGKNVMHLKKNVELLNEAVGYFNFYVIEKKTDE